MTRQSDKVVDKSGKWSFTPSNNDKSTQEVTEFMLSTLFYMVNAYHGGFEIVCAQLLMPRNFLYFWNNKIHVSSSGRNKVAQNEK